MNCRWGNLNMQRGEMHRWEGEMSKLLQKWGVDGGK